MNHVVDSLVVRNEATVVTVPRRLQFSLRALLLLIVLASAFCSWVMHERRHIEQRRVALEQRGVFMHSRLSKAQPKWSRWLLGDDAPSYAYAYEVVSQAFDDRDLNYLSELTRLECLSLNKQHLSDKWLLCVSQLESLEELQLDDCFITSAGLDRLTNSNCLKQLLLIQCGVTDGHAIDKHSDSLIVHLQQLKQLQLIEVLGSDFTDQGEAALRLALPRCEIYCNSRYLSQLWTPFYRQKAKQ